MLTSTFIDDLHDKTKPAIDNYIEKHKQAEEWVHDYHYYCCKLTGRLKDTDPMEFKAYCKLMDYMIVLGSVAQGASVANREMLFNQKIQELSEPRIICAVEAIRHLDAL